jgi:hypothetical protein
MSKIFIAVALCLMVVPAFAQKPASDINPAINPPINPANNPAMKSDINSNARKIDDEFVHQQFGDQFTFISSVGVAYGDLDGDGVEDVVIAARCKNPMLDQSEHDFTVIDPYNAFFGYGNPEVTTTFSEGDPSLRGLVILVIDGSGPEGWRSPKPKAKFVVVNLPYKALYVRKFTFKKKRIEALYVEEAGRLGANSAVFFDGKKFQYVPMGGDME